MTIAAAAAAVVVLGGIATWALLARWSSDNVPLAEARAQITAAQVAPQARDGADAARVAPTAQIPVAPPSPTENAPLVAVAPVDAATPANASTSPAATVLHPTVPAAAPMKPATAATSAATATAPKETAKDRKAREAREREAREADARAASSRLVAPATGTVRIAISPWGLVEVDGTSSGAAPPITELTLAEGKHQIVVRNGDYPAYTTQVTVTAGQIVTLRHKFGS
jgi:serine/threonine-protein kinase